jgi:hypothetical protein
MPAPTIIAVSPAAEPAAGGTVCQLIGTYLDSSLTITVGGTSATSVLAVSQFLARFVCPAHTAGSSDVVATTSGGAATKVGGIAVSSPPPPAISSINPYIGPAAGGTPITIRGTGMASATAVTIGGTAATSFAVVDAGTITCTTPAKTVGPYPVVVQHPNGNATYLNGYAYY